MLFCDLSLRISFCMHLRSGRLVHNLEVIATMDPNSSNVLRDIQEQLQLMRTEISNMSNQMNNLSGRMESIETLQIRQSSESEILVTTIGILKDQFLVGTTTITNTRVTMTLMTLMIVSVPMITIKDQFILGTVNITAIRAITTMMTLTSES